MTISHHTSNRLSKNTTVKNLLFIGLIEFSSPVTATIGIISTTAASPIHSATTWFHVVVRSMAIFFDISVIFKLVVFIAISVSFFITPIVLGKFFTRSGWCFRLKLIIIFEFFITIFSILIILTRIWGRVCGFVIAFFYFVFLRTIFVDFIGAVFILRFFLFSKMIVKKLEEGKYFCCERQTRLTIPFSIIVEFFIFSFSCFVLLVFRFYQA